MNQFGFVPERSTMEAVFLLWSMKKYIEAHKDLYIFSTDLEKAYDHVLREVL